MANWWDSVPKANPLDVALESEGADERLSSLARSIYQQESSSGANTRTSNAGAVGGMQIKPSTFAGVADQGWDVRDPVHNARAGVRYAKQMLEQAGGDLSIAAAGYYGGPGGLEKARRGVAVSDPRNPKAPNTLQYGRQVADRGLSAVVPSANAAEVPSGNWWEAAPMVDQPKPEVKQKGRRINSATMGVGDVVRGGVQGLVHGIGSIANAIAPNSQIAKDFATGVPQVDALLRKQEQDYASQRTAAGESGTDWGRLGGNLLGSAITLGAMPSGTASLPATIGAGALSGAIGGALQPVIDGDFAREKARQMAMGAGFGSVVAPAAGLIGRAVSPKVTPEALALRREGITPTIGQTLGGTAARTEEKLTSVPFMGDAIKGAQRRAIEDLNRAAYNRALEPIGERFTGNVGSDGVKEVASKLSAAYDDVLNGMTLRVDPQLHADVTRIANALRGSVPDSDAGTFASIVRTQLGEKLGSGGTMDGKKLKGVQSELQRIASGYAKDPSFDKRQLGEAIGAVKSAIDANLSRVNTPEAAQRLADVNRGWANYTRIRQAAASTGAMNQSGVFTAAQLQSAVRGLDKSVGKGNVAKGGALMQDLSGPAQAVLGGKYPDSGTPGRLLLSGLLGGGAVMNPAATAATAGAGLAASAPYSQIGQRLIGNYLLDQSAGRMAAGQAIREAAPLLGGPAGLLGVGALQSR